MAAETKPDDPAAGERARAAGRRAVAGVVVIAALLGVLALLDAAPEEAAPPAAPVPAMPAPAAAVSTAAAAPAASETVAPALAETAAPPVAGGEPGKTDAPALAGPDGGAAPAPGPSATAGEPAPAPTPAAEPPVEPLLPPMAAVGADGKGFMLQLGVFGQSDNAQALHHELQRRGVPVRLETRVVAGPFPDRRSAEQAREILERAGMGRAMVVPGR